MKKINVKRVFLILFKAFWTAIAVCCILVSLNAVLRPLYLDLLDMDNFKIVATGESCDEAKANNVRISKIMVDGEKYALADVVIPDDSAWTYDIKNKIIYAYNLKEPAVLEIEMEDVHRVEITFVSEVGSGEVEVYIGQKLCGASDLYSNNSWSYKTVTAYSSFMVFPESYPAVWAIIFGIPFIVFSVLFFVSDKNCKVYDAVKRIPAAGILAVVIMFIICFMQYDDLRNIVEHISEEPQSFIKALVFIFILIELFTVISDRLFVGFAVTSVVSFLIMYISKMKVLYRNVPLLPWDFSLAKETASIVSSYDISMGFADFLCVALIVGIIISLVILHRKSGRHIALRIGESVVICGILVLFILKGFVYADVEINNIKSRVYRVNNYYDTRGFVSAFLEFMIYVNPHEEPEGYSKEYVDEICHEIKEKFASEGDSTPTIIAIMSESFWDMERMEEIEFAQTLLPNYHELTTESRYGETYSHVFGGGTVISEFEMLTGFSGKFFPADYMVYGNSVGPGFDSAVSIFEAQGYSTLAIHPYYDYNYNRETAYGNLGFDSYIFEDDFDYDSEYDPEDAAYFDYSGVKVVRNYVSDEAMFDRIITEYENHKNESDSPQFIFGVTMQNHGGYAAKTIYEDMVLDFSTSTYGEGTINCITDYSAGLHESDRALGEFVDYFRNVDDNVIIVYFGDHMTDAGLEADKILENSVWNNNYYTYTYEIHRTPFLIWSNFDNTSENLGMIEISQLLPITCKEYGINGTPFWSFVDSLGEYYDASDSVLFVEDGEYQKIDDMNDEQKKWIKYYEILQYDYMWGKRYAEELWSVY